MNRVIERTNWKLYSNISSICLSPNDGFYIDCQCNLLNVKEES